MALCGAGCLGPGAGYTEQKIEQAIRNTPEPLRSDVRFLAADITDAEFELPQDGFEVAILAHSL